MSRDGTRSLPQSADTTVELVSSDPVAIVQSLNRQDGKDSWLLGGGTPAGALPDEADRLIGQAESVGAGDGGPFFGRNASFSPELGS